MYIDSSSMLTVIINLSRQYGRVFQVWIGPLDTVVTSVPEDVAQILSTSSSFARPNAMQAMFEAVVPRSVMVMRKELHLETRKRLREQFNHAHLKGFHGSMSDAVAELCQSLAELASKNSFDTPSAVVNMSEHLAVTVFRIITNTAFGCNLSREERLCFAKGTDLLVDEMMLDFVGYPLRQALTRFGVRNRLFRSSDTVNKFCRKFIQARLEETTAKRASRCPDLLDAIISLGGKDLVNITSQTVVFAVAGSHTTIETLAWSIYEACRNPRVAFEIQRELHSLFGHLKDSEFLSQEQVDKVSYLRYVWKETLRKHPPGPMFLRAAMKDVQLSGSGVHLPKGTNVVALAHRSHTNSKVWTDPEKFLPERWSSENGEGNTAPPGSYVPFSLGARNCPGRFLADHEGALILAELYRRFNFSLACDPDDIITCCGWVKHARTSAAFRDVGVGLPVRVSQKTIP